MVCWFYWYLSFVFVVGAISVLDGIGIVVVGGVIVIIVGVIVVATVVVVDFTDED